MAAVVVTLPARDDIDVILSYLLLHAGQAVAFDYRAEFRVAFRRRAAFPESGAPRPGLGRDVRLVTVKPYVVLHRYGRARDIVVVLRVLHGRRRLALDAP